MNPLSICSPNLAPGSQCVLCCSEHLVVCVCGSQCALCCSEHLVMCVCVCVCVCVGDSNGTPLQYSYLENPMDGGAWWVAVHGVSKSQT